MKTEKEQTKAMIKILLEASKKCFDTDCNYCDDQYEKDCAQYRKAMALVQAGYGDVSEYKAEIERLKDENETLKNDLINSEGNLNHITTEFERLKAKSNEQSRKAGILGYNVTVEFHDDEVSEHSVDCKDIEKYAKQFRNRIISINEKEIKQAKIDILNKLKEEMGDVKVGAWTATQIDELIKEVENGQ